MLLNTREYHKSSTLPPCKLNGDDLLTLQNIMKEGYPKEAAETFSVSTHFDHTQITSSSIEDFLAQQDLPASINNITVSILCPERIYIHADDGNNCYLHISGYDETRVMGKYARLISFFKRRRAWYWPVRSYFIVVTVIVSVACFATFFLSYSRNIPLAALSAFIYALWWFIGYPPTRNKLLPATQVIVTSRTSLLSKEHITILVGILGIIVMLVQLLVMLVK